MYTLRLRKVNETTQVNIVRIKLWKLKGEKQGLFEKEYWKERGPNDMRNEMATGVRVLKCQVWVRSLIFDENVSVTVE
jgi:hypothetical protein